MRIMKLIPRLFLLFLGLASAISTNEKPVLVLGSAGLIGAVLVNELEAQGYKVYGADIQSGKDYHNVLDLREPNALDIFNDKGIEFVFFLACDVGGSK